MLLKKWLRGRLSLFGLVKVIRFWEFVYNLWRVRKIVMGFGNIIDSVFVEILLYCFYNGIRDFGEIVLR